MNATYIDEATRLTRAVADLHPHPLNPRTSISDESVADLVASIREMGVLQPLLILPDSTVVAGHRRLRAAQIAGVERVPVEIRELSETEQLSVMLVENIQREDLTPVEEAQAFRRLTDAGLGRNDIARRCGLNASYVSGRLTILKLDPAVQQMFGRRELPVTLVWPLAKVGDLQQQRRLAALAATRRMTVRQIEDLIEQGSGSGAIKPAKSEAPEPAIQQPNGPGRREVVEALRANPSHTLTFEDLLKVFDGACSVCQQCGMADLDQACKECPGPAMVKLLVKGGR